MADKFLSGESIQAGTTSVSLSVFIQAEDTGAGADGLAHTDITAGYWRQGGDYVAITEAALADIDGAYSAGGWKELDATNAPGVYRFDIPDTAFATGADWVTISIKSTGNIPYIKTIALPTYETFQAAVGAMVVESAGTYTLQQALSIMLAALAGVTATEGTVIKTPDGSATRISATINVSNERTAMTLSPSA